MTQETSVVLASFDYELVDEQKRNVVRQRTGEIKSCVKNGLSDVFEIGNHLREVSELLEHGQWEDWLSAEFDWAQRTALNFMRVAEVFKKENFADIRQRGDDYGPGLTHSPNTRRKPGSSPAVVGFSP